MEDPDKIQIQIMLDRNLHRKLVLQARYAERSLAAQARFIITQWIIQREQN